MNINVARSHYVNQCKSENQKVLNSKYLLKYERDNQGRHVGVVISFRDTDGKVKIGWSRCHAKLEPFDKQIGINKAIRRAKYYNEIDERTAPHGIQEEIVEMRERAERYFQLPLLKV